MQSRGDEDGVADGGRANHPRPPVAEVFTGSVAAELATKSLLHPLDTLKTRLQYLVLPRRANTAQRLPIVGDVWLGVQVVIAATRSPHHSLAEPEPVGQVGRGNTVRKVGAAVRSLYRGIGPQLLGVVPIALVYMPTYEFTKSAVRGTVLEHTPTAGIATGLVSALVRVPISLVKSRLQLGQHPTAISAVRHALKLGSGGLYVGLHATIAVDVCYAAVQFTTLEQLTRLVLRWSDNPGAHYKSGNSAAVKEASAAPRREASHLSASVNAMVGFSTGVIAAIITEPLDVIRTRLMTQRSAQLGEGAFGYESLADGLRKAVRSEGVLSLWKGLLPRLVTKGLGSLVWYTSYMEVRRLVRAARASEGPGGNR